MTNKYVKKVNKKTKICCTQLENYSKPKIIRKICSKKGGGFNHRYNLSDEILIKDNHISAENNLKD